MRVLWKQGRCTVRQVREALREEQDKETVYTTWPRGVARSPGLRRSPPAAWVRAWLGTLGPWLNIRITLPFASQAP